MTNDSFNATVEYARNAIRGAFLINGGAAIALLTFLGKNMDALSKSTEEIPLPSLSISLVWFSVGISCAVLSSAFAYLSQGFYTQEKWTGGNVLRGCGILVFVGSISCFVLGMLKAAYYFQMIGI